MCMCIFFGWSSHLLILGLVFCWNNGIMIVLLMWCMVIDDVVSLVIDADVVFLKICLGKCNGLNIWTSIIYNLLTN